MTRRGAMMGAALAAAVALAVAAYWWASPILVLRSMQRAAARGDMDAVAARIDAVSLRENLKAQFSAAMAGKIGEPQSNPLSAMGNALGMAFVEPLVAVMVRPQTIASALQTGRVRPGGPSAAAAKDPPPEWELQREGADRASFRPRRPGGADEARASVFVFVRHGFADWKLTAIELQLDR